MSYDTWKTASPYDGGMPETHAWVEKLLEDYESLHDFYRSVYKSVECGPTVGFLIFGDDIEGCYDKQCIWLYNDELPTEKLDKYLENHYIAGISISSIVEGSDAEVPPIKLIGYKHTPNDVWNAINDVNKLAIELWHEAND